MTRKSRRLILIAACGGVLALAVGLILFAMSGSIVFFRSPTEIAQQGIAPGTRLRLGGLVKDGSLKRGPDQTRRLRRDRHQRHRRRSSTRACCPTCSARDRASSPRASLEPGGMFRADTVLAKHDESYMPREVADALKAQGRWQEGGATRRRQGRAEARRPASADGDPRPAQRA